MDPKHTALILVGFQNDYFAQDGILRGVIEEPNRVDNVLANTLRFIETMKDTPLTIISTPIVLEPDYRAMANSVGILDAMKKNGAFKAGTTGADTIPELLAFGDRVRYVSGKVGFNAFSNTSLDDTLRARNITNVLVCGMVTSLCIDSTGRAAYERGYAVTIVSDCSSSRTPAEQDFFCSSVFPLYAGVATSTELADGMLGAAV